MNIPLSNFEKEHVTPFIKSSKNIIKENFSNKHDLSFIKLSVDTIRDLRNVKKVFKYF